MALLNGDDCSWISHPHYRRFDLLELVSWMMLAVVNIKAIGKTGECTGSKAGMEITKLLIALRSGV